MRERRRGLQPPACVSVERVEVVPQDREKPTLQIGTGLEAVEVELGAEIVSWTKSSAVCELPPNEIAKARRLGMAARMPCRILAPVSHLSSAQVPKSNLINRSRMCCGTGSDFKRAYISRNSITDPLLSAAAQ